MFVDQGTGVIEENKLIGNGAAEAGGICVGALGSFIVRDNPEVSPHARL